MAGGSESVVKVAESASQYPLRRASSWRVTASSLLAAADHRLNTLSGGHPLGGAYASTSVNRMLPGLNTLSGGHPLGGSRSPWHVSMPFRSQYPLRRASSWRARLYLATSDATIVSIPSQAGILLAAVGIDRQTCELPVVSIPSQAGILLAGDATVLAAEAGQSLNTLSGGHPLGGMSSRSVDGRAVQVSIPSQAGILLAASGIRVLDDRGQKSQYPLRRASSWRACSNG